MNRNTDAFHEHQYSMNLYRNGQPRDVEEEWMLERLLVLCLERAGKEEGSRAKRLRVGSVQQVHLKTINKEHKL